MPADLAYHAVFCPQTLLSLCLTSWPLTDTNHAAWTYVVRVSVPDIARHSPHMVISPE